MGSRTNEATGVHDNYFKMAGPKQSQSSPYAIPTISKQQSQTLTPVTGPEEKTPYEAVNLNSIDAVRSMLPPDAPSLPEVGAGPGELSQPSQPFATLPRNTVSVLDDQKFHAGITEIPKEQASSSRDNAPKQDTESVGQPPLDAQKFEQSAAKLTAGDTLSLERRQNSAKSGTGNSITQNEVNLESEAASDREVEKVQTFGKE